MSDTTDARAVAMRQAALREGLNAQGPQNESAFDPEALGKRGPHVGARRIWGVLREAYRRFDDDDHAVYAGHMAFTLLLSLGPFVVCAIILATMIDSNAGEHIRQMIGFLREGALMPDAMATLFTDLVDSVSPQAAGAIDAFGAADQARRDDMIDAAVQNWLIVGVTTGVGLFAGSSAFEAARNGFNEAYDAREKRAMWFRRSQSLILAFFIASLAAIASFAFVAATISLTEFSQARDIVGAGSVAEVTFQRILLYAFVAFVAFMFWVLLLGIHITLPRGYVKNWHIYVWAQDEIDDIRAAKIPLTPGVYVSAAMWLIFAIIYSVVIGTLVQFESNHGRLAGVVATLLFFYISSSMIFFGAQINIAIATIGEDGNPKWPHPSLPRPEGFDETQEEAAQVLLNSRPDHRLQRLWFYICGGASCRKPVHHAEEERLRRAEREARREARRSAREEKRSAWAQRQADRAERRTVRSRDAAV